MKKAGITLLVMVLVVLPTATSAQTRTITVPGGTPVEARVVQDIDPEQVREGDTVLLEVHKNVVIGNDVVIRKGARVIAEVSEAKEKGYLGQSAKIVLTFRTVTAVDDKEIFVSGSGKSRAEDKAVTSVGLGVLCCPLFLLMKGEETIIPAGKTLLLYTVNDATVRVK